MSTLTEHRVTIDQVGSLTSRFHAPRWRSVWWLWLRLGVLNPVVSSVASIDDPCAGSESQTPPLHLEMTKYQFSLFNKIQKPNEFPKTEN